MNKYTKIVKKFKLRKYYKSAKRFSSKKYITETLPRRFKKVSKMYPGMFKNINEISKNSKSAIIKIFEREEKRLNFNTYFNKYYHHSDYKYKPGPYLKLFLQTNNLRTFDKKLNKYFFTSNKTQAVLKIIMNKSLLLKDLDLRKQNEVLITYFKKLSEEEYNNKLSGILVDSETLIELVANDLAIEVSKENVDDISYMFDEDD